MSENDPYARELLALVLPWFVEDDWRNACEKCIEVLLRIRGAHSLVIHSRDENVIREFALRKPVGRLLVNTPAALGGIGATTGLFPAMTLGGPGEGGITADNVSPLNFIYRRKVDYGLRNMDGTARDASLAPVAGGYRVSPDKEQALREMVARAVTIMDQRGASSERAAREE